MKPRQIWKFVLRVTETQAIEMPNDALVLCVQMQNGNPCLWAMVDPDKQRQRVNVTIVGTGHPIETAPGNYVGTVHTMAGALVCHVFVDCGVVR